MKVTELIEALNLVGRVYRNRDGSKPADAITKVIQQLKGGQDLTLAEWVQESRTKPEPQTKKKPGVDTATIDEAILRLEQAETHADLHAEIGRLKLKAGEWKALAKKATGKSGSSGKAAKELTETHFSNLLLMQERMGSVKRLFR